MIKVVEEEDGKLMPKREQGEGGKGFTGREEKKGGKRQEKGLKKEKEKGRRENEKEKFRFLATSTPFSLDQGWGQNRKFYLITPNFVHMSTFKNGSK